MQKKHMHQCILYMTNTQIQQQGNTHTLLWPSASSPHFQITETIAEGRAVLLSKARGLAVTAGWPDPVTPISTHPPILLLNPIWGRADVRRPDSISWEGSGTCVLISSSLRMALGWCTGSTTCYQEHCFQSTHNKMKYYSNDVLHVISRVQIISVSFLLPLLLFTIQW